MKTPIRNLARTAAALVAYDKAGQAVDDASPEQADAAFAIYDTALVQVSKAYALDTADRNRAEECAIHSHQSHILQFIRRMVSEQGVACQ